MRGRSLVLAGAVVTAVTAAVLLLDGRSAGDGVRSGSRAAHGAQLVRYRVWSGFVHRSLPQVAVIPPGGGAGRPLLVFLHGRGGAREESNVNGAFLAALAAQGAHAPDVVFPSGGDHSYWHSRRDGRWDRYVLDEVIPSALRRTHGDARRLAIGGISMGGYGAFEIARRRPRAFCAVGGHSAATWLSPGASAPGAFDDAADFRRHDVVRLARARGRRPWGHAALWLDGGSRDPFRQSDLAFARALGIRFHSWPGGHDGGYWGRHYRDYLRFYSRALARC